jgi:hypothetical protein
VRASPAVNRSGVPIFKRVMVGVCVTSYGSRRQMVGKAIKAARDPKTRAEIEPLFVSERVPPFCLASGIEWQRAGVTGKTVTAMVVKGTIERTVPVPFQRHCLINRLLTKFLTSGCYPTVLGQF